jgi:CDP-diacylglycerol--serine O-phosphatidyltransferase
MNAVFGLVSILRALEGDYFSAAGYILLAILMDSFDGRLARALGSSSYFGMELDSLCDAVSFCLAPVVLLYSWHLGTIGFVGTAVLAFYLCAGLFRLARFNCKSSDGCIESFTGLPTTAAAFFIASLVMFNLDVRNGLLFIFVVIISSLMISSIKLPSFKK